MSGEENKILKKVVCVGIVTLLLAGCAKANLVDSNSIFQDGIEYYIQTNKSVYDLGEEVQMLYRVTNLGNEAVTFQFTHGPEYRQCDFIVQRNGESIWDTLDWPITFRATSFTLNPSEFREYAQIWDMTYNNGDGIVPGNYNVTGVLSYYPGHERYVPLSVSIEVIPEPASLLLLGTGSIGLLAYNRKKNNHKKIYKRG